MFDFIVRGATPLANRTGSLLFALCVVAVLSTATEAQTPAIAERTGFEPKPPASFASQQPSLAEATPNIGQSESEPFSVGLPSGPDRSAMTPAASQFNADAQQMAEMQNAPIGLPAPPGPNAFNPIGSEGNAGRTFANALATPGPFAGWKDGFFLQSADNDFVLRITGQVQADYRTFINTDDRTDLDQFLMRRARFGLEATLLKYYEFRFLPDFGQGQAVIQDCYMNIHYCDDIQVELGKFKQPFSYEQLIQDRYVPTMERSLIDQLVPARDVGVMIHGQKLLANRLDYGISVSNGEINGNGDPSDSKDVNGRIAVRPFNSEDFSPALVGLQVGFSGTFGVEEETMAPATLRTPDTVPFFTFSSTARANGVRTRLSPELAYFWGPFGFLTQYFRQTQEIAPSATGAAAAILHDVPFEGYFFLGSLLLTGETRTTYSERISPLRPFDPRCPCASFGAWEIVFRYSHLRIGDDVFAGTSTTRLANPVGNSDAASEAMFGINWYWNNWVRVQFNYEHDWFAEPVNLGPTVANRLPSQDSLFTRFQIMF